MSTDGLMKKVTPFDQLTVDQKREVNGQRLANEEENKAKEFYNKKHGITERTILNG